MQAIGNDGQWHDWEELSQEERDAWMDAMTEADRRHDYYKTNEKPRTLKQQLLDYETDHRIC
jgi:N-acetyl-anhydromuramyl-L-alanine amidase AmpD